MRGLTFLADAVDYVLNGHVPDGVPGSSRRRLVEELRAAVLVACEFTVVPTDAARDAAAKFNDELQAMVFSAADRVLVRAIDRPALTEESWTEIESSSVTGAPCRLLITAIVYPKRGSGRMRMSCSIALAGDGTPVAIITELRPETDG